MKTLCNNRMIFLYAILMCTVLLPVAASAQEFVSLSGLEGIEAGEGEGLANTFNTIYILVIIVGAIFAVIKIALAGTKYMLSDVVTDKAGAKKDIQGAILGLVIILATYLVLYTIYPGLVDFNILQEASIEGTENLSNVVSSENGVPSCKTC